MVLVGMLQSCLGTRHLEEGEWLLYQQRVKAPRNISKGRMLELTKIETNQKFLGLPIHLLAEIYYAGKNHYDTARLAQRRDRKMKKIDRRLSKVSKARRINNLQFKKQQIQSKFDSRIQNGNVVMQWGEPLAVLDSNKIARGTENIRTYLSNNGYFRNSVLYAIKPLHYPRTVRAEYEIIPGPQYRIDSVFYSYPDTVIENILNANLSDSFLKKGEPYSQDNLLKERERIDLTLREYGYFDFSQQYIEYQVDTFSSGMHRVWIRLVINKPAKRGYHKQFVIDEVNFFTDAAKSYPGLSRNRKTYRNINFYAYEDIYNLKILSQRVFLYPGQMFSRTQTLNTQRQLANLDNFKFVNINFDTTGGRFIANIFTSRFDRYQWSNEVGLSVTQGFPGPFYNISFKKRNIFRGLENFEMNGRIGYEGVAAATELGNVYQSMEAGIQASIIFPQFLWPLREEIRYKQGSLNPRTRTSMGFNYTDRPEYKRAATSLNITYNWESQRIRRFDLTLASLGIINSILRSDFNQLLDSLFATQGNTLKFSFQPSYISFMGFGMTWNHNNYGNLQENSVYLRWSVESGGTLQNLFSIPAIENRGLQTFRYLRLQADIRKLQILDKKSVLAMRFNGGIGYSYGDNRALPYEKYFFAGGSNSVRAWRPRRLGPGSFRPEQSANPDRDGLFRYQFEIPGEILLEGSVELRRKLFGFFEGALFLDAGNVWLFSERIKTDSEGNPIENGNSKFRLDSFYKELGVGTGFGFRFNFNFLLLRFDVGIKVYDPARPEGDRFVLDKVKFTRPFGINREPVIFNLGVGFPF
jgi:outer membrane protein insertion porin family